MSGVYVIESVVVLVVFLYLLFPGNVMVILSSFCLLLDVYVNCPLLSVFMVVVLPPAVTFMFVLFMLFELISVSFPFIMVLLFLCCMLVNVIVVSCLFTVNVVFVVFLL